MFSIVLNQTNLVQDGLNNKMVFKFPNSVNFKNNYIAVSSIAMYYSWFNVSAVQGNNNFTYTWVDSVGASIVFNEVIPDGLYEVSDLNKFVQFVCIKNGTYWAVGTTNYYPFEFLLNINRYAVQVNTYLVPNAPPPGATVNPAPVGGAPGYPAIAQNVVVVIPPNLSTLFGFTTTLTTAINLNNTFVPPVSPFVSKNALGTISYISNTAPQIQPNGSLYISISNINNPYTQPSSIIYAINPSVAIGAQILDRPPNYSWSRLIDGTYNELRISFLGSNLQPIPIKDPNMTLILVIKDGSEWGGK